MTDRTLWGNSAHWWRVVAVPFILGPGHEAPCAVFPTPFGEARAQGTAEGRIGERAAKRDDQPHADTRQPQNDEGSNPAAAVDPPGLWPMPDTVRGTGGVLVDIDLA